MKLDVMLNGRHQLRDLVEEITLEDSLEEIAYRANIRLLAAPDLPAIAPGHSIRVSAAAYDDDTVMLDLLNPGVVWECASTDSGRKHVNITAYDPTIYLAKSEDERLMAAGQTASQRLRLYARDWNIPVGDVPDTEIPLTRSVKRAQTIYAMIQGDLKETADKDGGLFRPRMTPTGLTLARLGAGSVVRELTTLESLDQTRTLEGAVTQVKVLGEQADDKRLSPVLAIVKGETEKYGTLQKVLQDCAVTTVDQAKAAARNLLLGMQESFTVTAPDIPAIRAGDRVKLNGMTLYVTRVTHRLGDPGHMDLELSAEAKVRRDWCV